MNLYYISQSVRSGWDTYDSAVVAAKTAADAKTIHPANYQNDGDDKWWEDKSPYGAWAPHPDNVEAELIGRAKRGTKRGVIVASFNAG